MAVTCALQSASRHWLSSSPFLTSQQRTSSLAPTIARPAPVRRAVPETSSSLAQTAFDEAEATRPKVLECSNFLQLSAHANGQFERGKRGRAYRYDLTMSSAADKNLELRDQRFFSIDNSIKITGGGSDRVGKGGERSTCTVDTSLLRAASQTKTSPRRRQFDCPPQRRFSFPSNIEEQSSAMPTGPSPCFS